MDTPLKGLVFDFDGTIADTLPMCLEAFSAAAERHSGRWPGEAEVRALFGASEEGMFARLLGDADVAVSAVATYLEELELYAQRNPSLVAPFPGLVAVFEAVRRAGVRLAIVSGKGAGSLDLSVRVMGLDAHFEEWLSGSTDGCIKAGRLRDLLARWDCPPSRVLHVGDTPFDVVAARGAGVAVVGAAWSPGTDRAALERAGPDYLFDDVADFARFVGTLIAAS